MAANKPKRPRSWKQQKFPIYTALYNLNVAFQMVAYEIERIGDYEVIPLETLRLYRMTAEELRSAMNHRLTGILLTREEQDRFHYGQQRIRAEEKLSTQEQNE